MDSFRLREWLLKAEVGPWRRDHLNRLTSISNYFLVVSLSMSWLGSIHRHCGARIPTALHRLQLPQGLCLVDWLSRRPLLLSLLWFLQAQLQERQVSRKWPRHFNLFDVVVSFDSASRYCSSDLLQRGEKKFLIMNCRRSSRLLEPFSFLIGQRHTPAGRDLKSMGKC